jgi:hypothetical protein
MAGDYAGFHVMITLTLLLMIMLTLLDHQSQSLQQVIILTLIRITAESSLISYFLFFRLSFPLNFPSTSLPAAAFLPEITRKSERKEKKRSEN